MPHNQGDHMEATNTEAVIRCTEVTDEKLPKSLEELSEFVTENHESVLRNIVLCLEELSQTLRKYASVASDLPAPDGRQDWKREQIQLWREQADHMDICARAVWTTTMKPEHIYQEVSEFMLRGIQLSEKDVPWTPTTVRVLADERARNLAEMFRGRILPERLHSSQVNHEKHVRR